MFTGSIAGIFLAAMVATGCSDYSSNGIQTANPTDVRTTAVPADSIPELSGDTGAINPVLDYSFFEDLNRQYTFRTIHRADGQFHALNHHKPTFGRNRAPFWIRLYLRENSSSSPRVLEIPYRWLDQVELYIPLKSGGYLLKRSGDVVPFSERDVESPGIHFLIPDDYEVARPMYVHVKTSGLMRIPVDVYSFEHFERQNLQAYVIHGLYLGAAVIMLLFNFFVYLALKDRSYLLYVLYMASYVVYLLAATMMLSQFLFPDRPYIVNRLAAVLLNGLAFFGIHFCRSFLSTRKTQPVYDSFLWIAALWYLVLAFFTAAGSYGIAASLTSYSGLLVTPLILVAGIQSLKAGNRSARFFLAAWGIYLAAILIKGLEAVDLSPFDTIYSTYVFYGGGALESALLAIALADRINQLREEKELEKAALRMRIADDLHDDIGSKTSGIALLLDHSSRNPSLDEPYRLLLQNAASMARQVVDDLRDTVWIIDYERDYLPDLLTRLKKLADQLVQGLEHEVHTPDVVPNVEVNMEARRNILMIVKEMFQNAIKHAGATKIVLDVEFNDRRLVIRCVDNGHGFDRTLTTEGRGLKTMAVRAQKLGGSLDIQTSPGTGTVILLSAPIM